MNDFEFFIDSIDENNHVLYIRSECLEDAELGCYSTLDEAIKKGKLLCQIINKEVAKKEMNIAYDEYIEYKEVYESYE